MRETCFFSRNRLSSHRRARFGQRARVEGSHQLTIASLRLLSSGELRLGSKAPPTLGPNADRVALQAAREVCRLPPADEGGRLKALEEEFSATCLPSSFVIQDVLVVWLRLWFDRLCSPFQSLALMS